jgi:cytidylate kinase
MGVPVSKALTGIMNLCSSFRRRSGMAVISISRQLGSFGNDIAHTLAEELNYQLMTREFISTTLLGSGFSESKVIDTFAEDKAPSLLDSFAADRDRLQCYMKAAMYTFAQQDNVIVMGMGSQVLFQQLPHTLRVKVTAPFNIRLKRIQESYRCDEHYANHLLHASDQARSSFTKYFFNEDWESIHLYDMIINTARISTEGATRLVKEEIQEFDTEEQAMRMQKVLADLILQQQILIRVLHEEELPFLYMNAVVEGGKVTLNGYSRLTDTKDRCETIVRRMPGVKHVVNEIFIEPAPPA